MRFPDELQRAAEEIAETLDRPFSYVVVKALERYVAMHPLEVPPETYSAARRESRSSARVEASADGPVLSASDVLEDRWVAREPEGECPKATCSERGPIGQACPLHPNLRFKVLP